MPSGLRAIPTGCWAERSSAAVPDCPAAAPVPLTRWGSSISNRVLAASGWPGRSRGLADEGFGRPNWLLARVSSAGPVRGKTKRSTSGRSFSSTISTRCHHSGASSERTRRRPPWLASTAPAGQRTAPASRSSVRVQCRPSAAAMATSSKSSRSSRRSTRTVPSSRLRSGGYWRRRRRAGWLPRRRGWRCRRRRNRPAGRRWPPSRGRQPGQALVGPLGYRQA